MATTAARGGRVAPSIFRSETFLFALVVLALGVVVPYYTRPTESIHPSFGNATAAVPVAVVPPVSKPSPIIIQPQQQQQQQQPIQQQPPVQYVAPSTPLLSDPPAAAAVVSQPSPASPAPITYILPLLTSTAKAVFRFSWNIPVYAYRIVRATIIRPLRYPLAIIWSILRPLTLLLEILYILFIRTPFSVVSWFVIEAIYPLYVFFGVAALLGGGVGYAASLIPKGLNTGIAQLRGSGPVTLTPPRPKRVTEKVKARPSKTVHGGNGKLSSFWNEEEFVKAEEEYAEQWQRERGY